MAVIEVETVESVNNLEALAEWVPFGRLKSPFHLYVPAAMVDVAKRLCTDSHIPVAEIHTYHWIGDEMRFLPVVQGAGRWTRLCAARLRSRPAKPAGAEAEAESRRPKPAKKPAREAGQENTGRSRETQIALPFLRFTRDKRGYETTSLVHAGRRDGRSRQRILYWFRTPPGVKVGRPALDEEAIRWIEEHNPDIEFDWPKILEAQPPAAPPPTTREIAAAAAIETRTARGPRPGAADEPGAAPPSRRAPRPRSAGTLRTRTVGTGTWNSEPELEPEPDSPNWNRWSRRSSS